VVLLIVEVGLVANEEVVLLIVEVGLVANEEVVLCDLCKRRNAVARYGQAK
jgi:hypothetical protein